MQHTQSHAEKVAAAAQQQYTALPPQAPVAPAAAGCISLPAATAFAAPAAASAEATGVGLTHLEQKTALNMHNILAKYKEANPFRRPVDWVAMEIPDYPLIIKRPMDLKTVRDKVRAGAYSSMEEWLSDMQLIWENCRQYNGEDASITRCAQKLAQAMERHMEAAIAGAAQKLSAAQRRADAAALAGRAAAGGGMPRAPREAALLQTSNTGQGPLHMAVMEPSPEPVHLPLKRVASGSNVQATGTTAAGPAAAAAAADGRGGLAKRGRLASANFSGGDMAGAPEAAAAAAAAAGPAAGNATPGVDYNALEQLRNTQAAERLGSTDADNLALLAVWKRVVAQRTQAASETEQLRQVTAKLKSSLLASEEGARQLHHRVHEEAAARAAAKKRVTELQAKNTQLQEQHRHQDKVLEYQRKLLEQQEHIIKQLTHKQQQP